jgi:4'-phosphopantetheinyl transferase EntD
MRSSPAPPAGPVTRPSRSWPRIGFCATAYGDVDALRPEEKTLVERAPAARRAEFAAGRACARGALHAAGVDAAEVPLLPDEHGAVRWPGGTIGSITHTTGWTGAVAGRRTGWGGISSLGLDAEQAEPLEGGVLDVIASPAERDRVRSLADADHSVPWSVVLFAAKEAAFKGAYPLTGRVLDHDEPCG